MSLNSKMEHSNRISSTKYGKGTICSIISNKEVLGCLQRNSLLPLGFKLTDPDYGYNSTINRALCIAQYNQAEMLELAAGSSAEDGLSKQLALVEFLKQNMIVVHLTNKTPAMQIALLSSWNVMIDTVEVMGSIAGILVPKQGTSINSDPTYDR